MGHVGHVGQFSDGSDGSWVTKCDSLSALHCSIFFLHVPTCTLRVYDITIITSSQNNFTKGRIARRCTWTFQSYSPNGANVHPHLIHASLDRPKSTSQRHLGWFSRFAGLTIVTEKPTNRPRYTPSVRIGRT